MIKYSFLFISFIIALQAVAEPSKSNLGARNLFQQNEPAITKIPYIQDGLVAWYDGEWNAGLWKHENNINCWMNLMTEIPATVMSGNISFTNNALTV